MWAAGGAGFALLAIIGALIRAAGRDAQRRHRYQIAERRHQETLAAIRATPARTPRKAPSRTPSVPLPLDALPQAAIVQAAEVVIRTRDATIFALQRAMHVELPTASRLMEALEHRGVVGPGQNLIAPREVLVKPEGLEEALRRLRA